MKKQLITLIAMLIPMLANAYDAEIDGIYYTFSNRNGRTATVTYLNRNNNESAYSGDITIPHEVTYNGEIYNVSYIDDFAFRGCGGLTSVTIPNSVISIGNETFSGCNALTSVVIPNNVSFIGYYAFSNCSGLASVTIPGNMTSIANGVFYNCSGLKTLSIPKGITKIGTSVFAGCSGLNSMVVDSDNPVFDSRNDCNAIIETNTNELIYGCNSTIIPDGITKIRENAFNECSGLKSIAIPQSITSIEDNAFDGCFELSSISVDKNNSIYDSRDNCNAIIETATNRMILACNETIYPSSVTSYSSQTFRNCVSVSLPEGLKEIGSSMFLYCKGLQSISIPSSVETIKEDAFYGCSGLKTVIIEDGSNDLHFEVYSITLYSEPKWFHNSPFEYIYIGRNITYQFETSDGNGVIFYSPFTKNTTLREVVLGDNMTIIPNNMFNGCTNLTSVVTPERMDSIGYSVFYGCENLTSFTIPSGVKTIGHSAFRDCKSLSSINISKTVTTIDEQAFFNCDGLTSISIPNNVIKINHNAFYGCTSLTYLEILDSEKALIIDEAGSYNSIAGSITSLYLGRNINTSYYNTVFGYNNTPFNLTIGKYVTELSACIFTECKIKTLTFENGTDTLKLKSYRIGNTTTSFAPFTNIPIDSVYLGRVVVGSGLASVTSSFSMRIGKTIEEIGECGYYGWKIDSLYIPNNIKKIGTSAFGGCNNLSYVKIEDGDEVLEFENGDELNGCALESLYLGRNVSYPENKSPFITNKERLSKLTFSKNVTEINDSEFAGCKSLTSLTFTNSLTKIGKQAFYGCEGLTSVSIPKGVMEIREDAFDLTRGLTSFTIEDGTERLSINNNFLNSPLNEVYLGRNIVYLEGFSPFSMLESLKVLKIGKDVSNIHDRAFTGCQNLKDVVSYAVNVPTTGQNVFTESYLSDATLHVLDQAYKDYSKTFPWYLFKNFMLIDADGNETPLPSSEGDASDNGMVNAEDIVEVVSHMMGYPSEGFNNKYADVNCDGIINIADIVSIVNIIMGQ